MKSHWLLIAIAIALLHNQAKSKNIGNDIIVNIGQTNGHNYGDDKQGGAKHENTQPDSEPLPSAAPVFPSKPVKQHSAAPANFTNAPKETMCSARGDTLQVEANAVQGHLKAGAKLGRCPKTTAPTTQPVNASTPAPQPSTPLPTNSSNNSSSPSAANNSTTPPANNSTTPTTSPRSSSSPAGPSPAPRTPAPSTSATSVPEMKESVRIPICLPRVNNTIVVPANLLGQFLGKGAKIGNCTAPPAAMVSPPPTTAPPAPTTEARPAVVLQAPAPTIIQPAQPAVIVRPRPITISSEECVTPRPTVGYHTKPQDNQGPARPKPRVNLL